MYLPYPYFFKANKIYNVFYSFLLLHTYQHNEMSCSLVYYGTDGCTCSHEPRREQSASDILDGKPVPFRFLVLFKLYLAA